MSAAIGALVGALVASGVSDLVSSSSDASAQGSLTVDDRLQGIGRTFTREWPRVEYSDGWYGDLYNSHDELEREFGYELWGLIDERGVDFARGKIENWRQRYAHWVEQVSARLRELSASDVHYEAVETIHFRGNLVLKHVDAMLTG